MGFYSMERSSCSQELVQALRCESDAIAVEESRSVYPQCHLMHGTGEHSRHVAGGGELSRLSDDQRVSFHAIEVAGRTVLVSLVFILIEESAISLKELTTLMLPIAISMLFATLFFHVVPYK